MAKLVVLDIKGKEKEKIDLSDDIYGGHVNQDVIHQAIVKYQASLRQGNASTKERGEVSGGGRKPYKQKGTGRARAGSTRSPLWKGGGVTFGPRPRDFGYSIPQKIKTAALREVVKSKISDQDFVCIDEIKGELSKTKEFVQILADLNLNGKILALLDGASDSVLKVTNNIAFLNVMRAADANAYDILRNKKLLVTKEALQKLQERIEK
ncbi:MAG: large subunit ribosomal protein L4 [Lysobacterales bacterium]